MCSRQLSGCGGYLLLRAAHSKASLTDTSPSAGEPPPAPSLPPASSLPEEQEQQQAQLQKEKEGSGGWADSYLKGQADERLTKLLDEASRVSPLRQCAADSFILHGSLPALAMQELLFSIDVHNVRAELGELAVEATASSLPCT